MADAGSGTSDEGFTIGEGEGVEKIVVSKFHIVVDAKPPGAVAVAKFAVGSFFPGAKAAVHAINVRKALRLEISGPALASDAMVAVDDVSFGFVGGRDVFGDIGVADVYSAENMGFLVGAGIADIEENGVAGVEFSAGVVNGESFDRGSFHNDPSYKYDPC